MWQCVKCREDVDDAFEVCWNCGTTRGGEVDPGFRTADEAPVIPNSPELIGFEPGFALSARPGGRLDRDDDFAGEAPLDLVECYWARDEFEARFVAEALAECGIPAVADADVIRQGLGAAAWGVPYFSPRVRVRAEDLEKARGWIAEYECRRRRPASPTGGDDVD